MAAAASSLIEKYRVDGGALGLSLESMTCRRRRLCRRRFVKSSGDPPKYLELQARLGKL